MKYFRIVAPDLSIDLGTSHTIVARSDKGIVVQEPTVLALDYKKLEILALGQEAKEMLGKTPENIVAVRPLIGGVISDFDLTSAMLEYYIHKAIPGLSLLAPRVTISVPSGATDVENRAIQDACLQSGARDVFLVEESLAAAFGAGVLKNDSQGVMIVNLGAGSSEVAVCSSYGVITSQNYKSAGDDVDKAIQDIIRDKYGLIIGSNTAENLKKTIGSLRYDNQRNVMEISGRDQVNGMPKSIDVVSSDITEAIQPFVKDLVDTIHFTLEKTPPELSADIMKKGILMTGGSSLFDGLDGFLEEQLGIHVQLSKHPMEDTILGTQMIMKNIKTFVKRESKND